MAKLKLDIVFENDVMVAVNKPSGMLTIPDREQTQRSLKDILQDMYGEVFTVHRIDKDTSGLVIFARNAEMHKYLSELFSDRKIEKYYMGVVVGQPEPAEGIIEAALAEHPVHKNLMHVNRNGKPSKTGYEVVESFPAYSLVSFKLYTGRTHQIRVHSKEIGHPLACDPLYGHGKPVYISSIKKKYNLSKQEEAEKPMLDRLALHAYKLVFTDADGELISLQADPPKAFRALMDQQRKHSRI